jgi:hypothetical protein
MIKNKALGYMSGQMEELMLGNGSMVSKPTKEFTFFLMVL